VLLANRIQPITKQLPPIGASVPREMILVRDSAIKDPENIKMPDIKNRAINFDFFRVIPDRSKPKAWKIK
jgi:hypothetical protein